MIPSRTFALTALAAFAFAAPSLARPSGASIHVTDAWCPPTPPGAPTAAGYLTLANVGHAAARLIGGSSPVAAQVQLHSMTTQGGVMRMRPMTGGLSVAPGATASIQPGAGMHLMLIGLKRPLRVGEQVPVTLDFARAGKVNVAFVVRPLQPAAPGGGGRIDHMSGMGGH